MEKFKTYEEYREKLIALGKRVGFNLDLDNPKTIQDKINWMKIYDTTPLKTKCADKIRVHEYCKEKLGEDICVPIIAIDDKAEDIEWNKLPGQFVIKCNHGSGMNIIVKDKTKLNIANTISKLKYWMNDDFAFRNGYEMQYHDIPHKIFIEEYKTDENQRSSLFDYKFWCFNGTPRYYTINNGNGHGDIIYYDMEDNVVDLYNVYKPGLNYKKPLNFNKMVEYAEKLSADFPFVRVDFYEVSGKVYLGELTFTPGVGFFNYKKKEYNTIFGNLVNLGPKVLKNGKKIIVSMTSWPKRICNVATVVESLLKQDLEPDIIQINLSEDEFKRKEIDLPDDLNKLLKRDNRVCIEWVSGNDGVFKKIIPTIKKYYGQDYFLLSVDDDWVYRHDYIKMMLEYLKKYDSDCFCLYKSGVIGNRMIYKSTMFTDDFWKNLTKEVIETRIDDSYIEHYIKCKGKKLSCFRPDDAPDITKRFNPIFPNSHNETSGSYSPAEIARAKSIISKIVFN